MEGKESEFVVYPLPPVRLLVAYNPAGGFSFAKRVEVRDLADVPLLLLVQGFGTRKSFDAACRLERMVPNVFMESAAPETLLALARENHGAGIVPSTAQIDRRSLQVSPLIFRGSQLTVDNALLWSGTRRLPRYAEAFSAMLAAHMRAVIPEFGAGDRGRHSIRRQKKMARD